MKTLLITFIAMFAFASPVSAEALATEGNVVGFNLQGISVTVRVPELSNLMSAIHIELDGCQLLGKTMTGGLSKGLGWLGLVICTPPTA